MLLPNRKPDTALRGEWDRQAACFPAPGRLSGTFSIGIFRWVPAAKGRMKKSAAEERIRGNCEDAAALLVRADARVAELNAMERPTA